MERGLPPWGQRGTVSRRWKHFGSRPWRTSPCFLSLIYRAEWVQRERLAVVFSFLSYAWHWGSQQGKLCECGAVTSCSVSVRSVCAWAMQCVLMLLFFLTVCFPHCSWNVWAHYLCIITNAFTAFFFFLVLTFFVLYFLLSNINCAKQNDGWERLLLL